MTKIMASDPLTVSALARERDELQHTVEQLQSQQVEEWLDLLRNSSVVPHAVERSVSWRITKPVRLMTASWHMVRTHGLKDTFGAIKRWVAQRAGRR